MNFEMVGKLSIPKASDKFSPYEDKVYDSGWQNKTLKFNVRAGDNSHLLQIKAGAWSDEKKRNASLIYVFTKGSVDDSGNKTKGETIQIPFKDRFTSKRLPEVAEFRKYVIDLEEPGRRFKLQTAANNIKEGNSVSDETLKELGVESEDQINDALETSLKKRHEYIHMWDFVDMVKKVVESDKYKDKKFLIKGNGEYQYSEQNDRIYDSLVPNRIYLAADDAEEYSIGNAVMYFGEDAVDDMSVEEKGKYYVSGYMLEYESKDRPNLPVPITIVVPNDTSDEKASKRTKAIIKKFTTSGDTYKEYGVEFKMLNGAQRADIKLEDLDDDVREDIECGLLTLEDVARDLGGSTYGDRVTEWQFLKPGRGYTSGSKESVFTADDFVIKNADDVVEDLFDDEDEL